MNQTSERHLIIGTAGHVDHGKSALIRALTGIDTDRLKEERERGISIDLGFAPLRLPHGLSAGIVDVPGHERFIHNMLAGIGGIDLVLLVVDVMEGVKPQTREHLAILRLLDIRHGIVVLTKCDLADSDWIDLVEEEIREEVVGTFLEQAPFCRVSSVTKTGLAELLSTIERLAATIAVKDSDGPLRLPIDRHFSVAGFGTVVTGTLLSGRVRAGDNVELRPGGEVLRVREVQAHNLRVDEGRAGQRLALNLAGLERARISRGAILGTPGVFVESARLDARLTLLETAPRPLKFRDPVHLHLGTARCVGIVALLDRDQLAPGESALVQIHLDRPLVIHRTDRFIVRSYSPMTTIGGGVVIDPAPARHKRFRDDVMATLRELESGEKAFLLAKLGALTCARLKELEQLCALGRERINDHLANLRAEGVIVLLGEQWLLAETLSNWQHRLTSALARFHAEQPLLPGMSLASGKGLLPPGLQQKTFDELILRLAAAGEVVVNGDSIRLPGFSPTPQGDAAQHIARIAAAYAAEGCQAKNRQEMLDRLGLDPTVAEPLLAYLFATGELVKLNDENFLHVAAYRHALATLRAHFATQQTLTLGEFRDKIASARKLTQALLEYWDRLKYTLRQGDARVAWKLPKE